MKNKLLLVSFLSVIAVALVHFLASYFYLYWTVWWFDNISHFLGGLAMGLFWFWVFSNFYRLRNPNLGNIIFVIIVIVLAVGASWEIFEYIFDIAIPTGMETYWQDTSYDLAADTLGALNASVIVYRNKLHV